MSIECIRYKEHNGNNLIGFCDFFVPKMGLEIYGCQHHQKGNQEWVNLPSKEYQKPDGTKGYAPVIRFREKSHIVAFGQACLDAIKARPAAANVRPEPLQTEMF